MQVVNFFATGKTLYVNVEFVMNFLIIMNNSLLKNMYDSSWPMKKCLHSTIWLIGFIYYWSDIKVHEIIYNDSNNNTSMYYILNPQPFLTYKSLYYINTYYI